MTTLTALPENILATIAMEIDCLPSFFAFRSTCSTLRKVTKKLIEQSPCFIHSMMLRDDKYLKIGDYQRVNNERLPRFLHNIAFATRPGQSSECFGIYINNENIDQMNAIENCAKHMIIENVSHTHTLNFEYFRDLRYIEIICDRRMRKYEQQVLNISQLDELQCFYSNRNCSFVGDDEQPILNIDCASFRHCENDLSMFRNAGSVSFLDCELPDLRTFVNLRCLKIGISNIDRQDDFDDFDFNNDVLSRLIWFSLVVKIRRNVKIDFSKFQHVSGLYLSVDGKIDFSPLSTLRKLESLCVEYEFCSSRNSSFDLACVKHVGDVKLLRFIEVNAENLDQTCNIEEIELKDIVMKQNCSSFTFIKSKVKFERCTIKCWTKPRGKKFLFVNCNFVRPSVKKLLVKKTKECASYVFENVVKKMIFPIVIPPVVKLLRDAAGACESLQ